MSKTVTRFWFGKHKGKTLDQVPRQYLDWCLEARAGGGEMVEAIADFLQIAVPKKVVKYAGQTITREQLDEICERPGFTQVNKIVDGVDVMGVANCSHLFDPDLDFPGLQTWDGESPPWLDQNCELNAEFAEMFGR